MQALIFDLDGTLADSLDDIADAMERVLHARKLPGHARTAYRQFVGAGARELVERALPVQQRADIDAALREFLATYTQHMVDRTVAYPGINELLASLVQRCVPIAILSNKPHTATVEVVAQLFPNTPFVAVLGQRDHVPRKPHPAGALEIAQCLNLPPARCGFVGDTAVDMNTAAAAGMISIGVRWGFRQEAELRAAGAAHLVSEPGEILQLVE